MLDLALSIDKWKLEINRKLHKGIPVLKSKSFLIFKIFSSFENLFKYVSTQFPPPPSIQ
jgi:hypothetical protein